MHSSQRQIHLVCDMLMTCVFGHVHADIGAYTHVVWLAACARCVNDMHGYVLEPCPCRCPSPCLGKRGSLSEAKYRLNPDAAHKLNFQSIRSIFDSFRSGSLQGHDAGKRWITCVIHVWQRVLIHVACHVTGGTGQESTNPDIVKLNHAGEEKLEKAPPANSRLIYRRASAEAKGELESEWACGQHAMESAQHAV